MNDITLLKTALRIGLADLLTGYVARERVGVRYAEISRAAAPFGLEFRHATVTSTAGSSSHRSTRLRPRPCG